MRRFYFHVRHEDTFSEDVEGTLLPDNEAALAETIEVAKEVLISRVLADKRVNGSRIELADEAGLIQCVSLESVLNR
jgi:hypothetical protein